jgi:DNA-binding LacI/PurR family transcriptional regulator
MATLRDIAQRAGVSIKTVSNVLNGRNQEQWSSTRERAERIRAIASELGYRPNAAARATRLQRSGQVGVCYVGSEKTGRINHLRLFETIEGIQHGLEEAGYAVCLVRLASGGADGRIVGKALIERMFDATLCVGHVTDHHVATVEDLAPTSIMVDNNLWRATGCIRHHELHAGELACRALLAAGCQRLLCLNPRTGRSSNRHYSWTDRLEGAQTVAWERGLPLRHELLDVLAPWNGFEAIAAELQPGTGVLALDASLALALQRWCSQREPAIALGGPLPIACANDSEDCQRIWPGLARVGCDRYALGREAAAMLLAQLAGEPPLSRALRGSWIPGDSCAPA